MNTIPLKSEALDRLLEQFPGFGSDAASARVRIEAMEKLLEGMFVIPGTQRRVGLDTIVGVIPVVGDVLSATMGAWIIWEAKNLGLSKWQCTRMAANVAIDTTLGAIPFVGDAFDFFYKSNTKNLKIIRKHLDKTMPQAARAQAARAQDVVLDAEFRPVK
ncbi:MAG: DUF4112 domain-containing protein [Pirellulales bacterium]